MKSLERNEFKEMDELVSDAIKALESDCNWNVRREAARGLRCLLQPDAMDYALEQKTTRQLAESVGMVFDSSECGHTTIAMLADFRDVALEEAAQIAEELCVMLDRHRWPGLDQIPAAIRAAKGGT
jgi:HEAT repeat protein